MTGDQDENARDVFFKGGMKQLEGLVKLVDESRGPKGLAAAGGGAGAIPAGIVFSLSNDEITREAEAIASWQDSYDVYIWLWAEIETKLASAYTITVNEGGIEVRVDVSRIRHDPPRNEIEALAADLAAGNPTLQGVHWFSAEARLIMDKVTRVMT